MALGPQGGWVHAGGRARQPGREARVHRPGWEGELDMEPACELCNWLATASEGAQGEGEKVRGCTGRVGVQGAPATQARDSKQCGSSYRSLLLPYQRKRAERRGPDSMGHEDHRQRQAPRQSRKPEGAGSRGAQRIGCGGWALSRRGLKAFNPVLVGAERGAGAAGTCPQPCHAKRGSRQPRRPWQAGNLYRACRPLGASQPAAGRQELAGSVGCHPAGWRRASPAAAPAGGAAGS